MTYIEFLETILAKLERGGENTLYICVLAEKLKEPLHSARLTKYLLAFRNKYCDPRYRRTKGERFAISLALVRKGYLTEEQRHTVIRCNNARYNFLKDYIKNVKRYEASKEKV